MNELEMKHLLEAALLAAGRPVTAQQLAELYDERERPSAEQIVGALQALAEDYQGRGLELLEVASGWRIQVRTQCVDFVSRLWQERPSRYSRALLETLALIAYRQPITRGEIEEIRGVAISSSIMRTLHDRNWIRVVGHREVPGRPEVLATTREFLDYFGLKALDQLPTLAELKDVETVGVQLEFNTTELSADDEATANTQAAASDGDSDGDVGVGTSTASEQTNTSTEVEATNEMETTDHTDEVASNETETETETESSDEPEPAAQ
jgi:segregation and condensation protein B